MQSIITATGSYLPEKILSNDDLATMVDTNDAWIRERTGITQRHIVAEGELTSHLAVKASRRALESVGYDAAKIDGIVVATSTPDSTMPSVAAKLQAALGITRGPALDVAAACTGFIYALGVAHGWIQAGIASRVLVVGAESMSRIVDWSDRGTCILFGDGAGAVILEASEEKNRGIRSIELQAQGAHADLLGTSGGIASTQTAGTLFMEGQEVFRHGVDKMSEITLSTLARAGLTLDDMNWLVPHQANARMIKRIARQLRLSEDKCVVTVPLHANTSAASIPLALDVANRDGRLKKGDIIAMPALGAGLTWGGCVVSW
ncbi:MAG: beta-ketoacyl-ACP synthase III [Alphaproteobacteria bacterium]|nr:beta-ketoacyl-ACP synthase III [Alphaproteobacteria bacterium]